MVITVYNNKPHGHRNKLVKSISQDLFSVGNLNHTINVFNL